MPTAPSRPAIPDPTPPRRRWGRWVLGILLVLLILIVGGGYLWVQNVVHAALPTVSGTVTLPGLSAPVTVVRDAKGMPHLSGATSADLFRAQGYVLAQDRLWQMDFYRRVGAGRLAEVLGDAAVPNDQFIRTL